MHEVALVQDAITQAERAARQAGAQCIERLTFTLATTGHITHEAVETLFAALSRGTMAEGALVVIEERPGDFYCVPCSAPFEGGQGTSATGELCPRCGEPGLPHHQGSELALSSIDVRD